MKIKKFLKVGKMGRWTGRLMLIAVGILIPEAMAWIVFPQRGLSFAESVAQKAHLTADKAPGTKRIFIFGASSVVGYHHLGRSSLSDAIEYNLQKIAPDVVWNVVNFGKPGEGSEFVFDATLQSLRYHPDLVLVYAGESELAPIPILRRQFRYRLERMLLKSKAFRVAREFTGVSAWPSVPDFRRHKWTEVTQAVETDQDQIYRSFESRGRQLCNRKPAETGVVYLMPILGIETGPSYYDELDRWEFDFDQPATRAYIRGILNHEAGLYRKAVNDFTEALRYDDRYAAAQHRLGLALQALGEREASETAMLKGFASDPFPRCARPASYERMLTGDPRCVVIPLAERAAQFYGKRYVPEVLIEDGCHATVELEFKEAQLILKDAFVQRQLGLTEIKWMPNYKQYRVEKKLDRRYFAEVYHRLVRYFQGNSSGDRYLRLAIEADPHHPELAGIIQQHRQDKTTWLARRQRTLNRWRKELDQRKVA